MVRIFETAKFLVSFLLKGFFYPVSRNDTSLQSDPIGKLSVMLILYPTVGRLTDSLKNTSLLGRASSEGSVMGLERVLRW